MLAPVRKNRVVDAEDPFSSIKCVQYAIFLEALEAHWQVVENQHFELVNISRNLLQGHNAKISKRRETLL